MESSDQIDELLKALQAFRETSKFVKATKENPFLKNKYADLASVIGQTKAGMEENNLVVLQVNTHVDGKPAVHTRLIHTTSKQWIGGSDPLEHKPNDAQAKAGATTYARRYGYTTILGLITGDDDDGNTANGRTKNEDKKQNTTDFLTLKAAMTKEMMKELGNINKVKQFVESVLGIGSQVTTPADVKKVLGEFRKQKKAAQNGEQ